MKWNYMVLDYTLSTIHQDLNTDEVCTVLDVLFVQPTPNFDVVKNLNEFVTNKFGHDGNAWVYNPKEEADYPGGAQ